MKKLISALLASAMCLTTASFTAFADDIDYSKIDSSKGEVDEEATNAVLELMKSGEYPLDFNGDGMVNYFDSAAIAAYYGEVQTQCIDLDGNEIGDAKSKLDAETRQRIHDYGDIVIHVGREKCVDALDASFLLVFLKDNGYFNGDVNHDGSIDALDASLVLEYYSLLQTKDDKRMDAEWVNVYYTGDINGDNYTNALDASEILTQYSEAQVNK